MTRFSVDTGCMFATHANEEVGTLRRSEPHDASGRFPQCSGRTSRLQRFPMKLS